MALTRAVGKTTRRRDRRLREVALTVMLDGETYPTIDWSLGGLKIAGYQGQRDVDEEIRVYLEGELRGHKLGGAATMVVVRRDVDNYQLAARFKTFAPGTWDELEQLSLRRLRPLTLA